MSQTNKNRAAQSHPIKRATTVFSVSSRFRKTDSIKISRTGKREEGRQWSREEHSAQQIRIHTCVRTWVKEGEIRKKSIEKRWERQTKAVCVCGKQKTGPQGRKHHVKRTRWRNALPNRKNRILFGPLTRNLHILSCFHSHKGIQHLSAAAPSCECMGEPYINLPSDPDRLCFDFRLFRVREENGGKVQSRRNKCRRETRAKQIRHSVMTSSP